MAAAPSGISATSPAASTAPGSTTPRRWRWPTCAPRPGEGQPAIDNRAKIGQAVSTHNDAVHPGGCGCSVAPGASRQHAWAAVRAGGLTRPPSQAYLTASDSPRYLRRLPSSLPSAHPPLRTSPAPDLDARVPDRELRRRAQAAAGRRRRGAVAAAPAAAAPAPPRRVDRRRLPHRDRSLRQPRPRRPHRDGRLVVDAGGLDFLKYVDGGWKTSWLLGDEGRRPSGRAGRRAVGDGLPARSTATASGAGDATLSITMRALAPQQRVSLFVNEKPLSHARGRSDEQALRRRRAGRAAARRATTACG